MERSQLPITNQERVSDRFAHEPDVPAGGSLLAARPAAGHLFPTAADGVPNGGAVRHGSRVSRVAHLDRVHRVRAEKVVRAHHGTTDVQEAQRTGLRMTNSSRWKIA